MASNIQRAGYDLVVYNRTQEKMQPLVATGAMAARSPREAVAKADIVITCLMDDSSVLENLTGEDGILAGRRRDTIHVGTLARRP